MIVGTNSSRSSGEDPGTQVAIPAGMPNIMCSQSMWRLVKGWSQPTRLPPRPATARLGAWAAAICKDADDTLVIALEVQTYLTLVFPYGDGGMIHDRFSVALRAALEDLGVDRTLVTEELGSTGPLCFSYLKDGPLREALRLVAFTCGIERLYHDDLRRVQRNLNDLPHDLAPDYVPICAVRRLFRQPPLRPA
jgi:hypothetical protein